jgi:hypothetical protein
LGDPVARQASAIILLKVRPRASRSRVERGADGGLVVCVHSPAADDAANREFVDVVAEALEVPKSAVHIVRGQKSRRKQIAVVGLRAAEARARLEKAAQGRTTSSAEAELRRPRRRKP